MSLREKFDGVLARLRSSVQGRSVVPPRSPDHALAIAGSEALVKDGDVLLWRGTYFISRLFELASMSWYSHAAFVLHWEGRPMVLQAGAFGIQAVPFQETVKKYHGLVDWYQLSDQAREGLKVPEILQEATSNLGLPFGLPHALRELAYRWTGFRFGSKRSKRRSGMFCSEYLSKCFRRGGLDILPGEADIHTFPDDIARTQYFAFQKTIYDSDRHGVLWRFPLAAAQAGRDQRSVPTLPIEPAVADATISPGDDHVPRAPDAQ